MGRPVALVSGGPLFVERAAGNDRNGWKADVIWLARLIAQGRDPFAEKAAAKREVKEATKTLIYGPRVWATAASGNNIGRI
jgi:hypothetical protein